MYNVPSAVSRPRLRPDSLDVRKACLEPQLQELQDQQQPQQQQQE